MLPVGMVETAFFGNATQSISASRSCNECRRTWTPGMLFDLKPRGKIGFTLVSRMA